MIYFYVYSTWYLSHNFLQKFSMLSFPVPFKQFLLLSCSLFLCTRMRLIFPQIFPHSTSIITRAFSSSSRNRSCQQTYRRWHTSIVNSRSLHVVKAWQEKRGAIDAHKFDPAGDELKSWFMVGYIYDPESLRSSRVLGGSRRSSRKVLFQKNVGLLFS